MADLRDVLDWLKLHIPHEYQYPSAVYNEVAQTLQSNPFIRPRTSIFVYEDGRSELLLCLEGLLPIRYRNNNYKIPVIIWLPQDYPQSPPMVYVTPKKDMIVKQSRNVDPNGKCYHPNLANWTSDRLNPNYNTSNLLAVTQLFQAVFSENPPVRSVNPPPQRQQTLPPPPLPPRPTAATGLSGPSSPTNQTASPIVPSSTPVSPKHPPPPPPRPPPLPPSLQSQFKADANGVSRSSSSSSLDQLGQRSPPMPQRSPPPLPPQPFRHPSPTTAYRSPTLPQPSYYDQFNRPRASSLTQQRSSSASPVPDILEAQIPPPQTSVLPPPPLPPNPEQARLVKHLNHLIQSYIQPSILQTREAQTEARHEREKLLNVEIQAEKEIAELTRLKDACERNTVALRDCIRNAQNVIEWAKNRGEVSGDEIVCAQTLVYDQLFNLVAEDLAIDDTIEMLAKALDYERISLDAFLKETRKLAREQFLIKALIQKILKAAGIEPSETDGEWVVVGGGMTTAEYYYS